MHFGETTVTSPIKFHLESNTLFFACRLGANPSKILTLYQELKWLIKIYSPTIISYELGRQLGQSHKKIFKIWNSRTKTQVYWRPRPKDLNPKNGGLTWNIQFKLLKACGLWGLGFKKNTSPYEKKKEEKPEPS